MSSYWNGISENQFCELVQVNSDLIVKWVISLVYNLFGNLFVNQIVIDVIVKVVNFMNLV